MPRSTTLPRTRYCIIMRFIMYNNTIYNTDDDANNKDKTNIPENVTFVVDGWT
jgi:hypothetical protein